MANSDTRIELQYTCDKRIQKHIHVHSYTITWNKNDREKNKNWNKTQQLNTQTDQIEKPNEMRTGEMASNNWRSTYKVKENVHN